MSEGMPVDEVGTDWPPIRVEVAGPDRTTFDHPAACFVTGSLDGRTVGCLSVDRQIGAHTGFEPRDVDRADLALLRGLAASS